AAWYKTAYGAEPGYSSLLDQLAGSPSERNRLLRSYFESSAEEREQGLKLPTTAHKAIAELVAAGFVRVVVTTNFDRLIEQALEAIGINPTVISTPDAVEGALPLVHTPCTIIKVHGDYLDTRIKNSPAELAEYDPRTDGLLDRVFDEFGLIVCGWSAEWDAALRSALERCPNHRFTTYWAARGDPQDHAKHLISLRRAQIIKIQDADTFFKALAQKVTALADLDKPHPLSAKVAVASLKKYLAEDRHRIDLHDLVMQETESLYAKLTDGNFPSDESVADNPGLKARFQRRVQRFEAYTETLQALFATGCFWGESRHETLWMRSIERIANLPDGHSGYDIWSNLRRYPALLLLYAGGIASIAAHKYGMLAALLAKPRVLGYDQRKPLVIEVNTWAVMTTDVGRMLPEMDRHFVPVSDHLYVRLREPLRDQIPSDDDYRRCFDKFEYLLGLAYADLDSKTDSGGVGPIGCFGWRYRRHFSDEDSGVMGRLETEARQASESWPPLQAGLFGGSLERFWTVKSAFDQFVQQQVGRWI
ncbi:MAG: SIR2 family protein, partial [Anaerolineae bacterium]|nr:SIR2 family protein [Anaerolineae bacterium]